MTSKVEHNDLIDRLMCRLSPEGRQAFELLIEKARAWAISLYLVGGSVRDLLLDQPSVDVDLLVEDDAPAFALALGDALGAYVKVHKRFGTAYVEGNGFAFDLATARSESYPYPGALPEVGKGTLEDDLARRDFTVNAIALMLAGPSPGRLVDPFGGLADLEARWIRILHDGSFIDDATRILRAVRYEVRLRFQIQPHTLDLITRDKGYLAVANQARIRLELHRLLEDGQPELAMVRCRELGLLPAVNSHLDFPDYFVEAFVAARVAAPAPGPIYLAMLALLLLPEEAGELALRLAATNAERRAMAEAPLALASVMAWEEDVAPSRVGQTLRSYNEYSLWALALAAPDSQKRKLVRRYLDEWRHVHPALDGHALRGLGVTPGPKMGEMINRLRRARLDGELLSLEDEVAAVRAWLGAASSDRFQ